jgi:hypothetical protein
LLGVWHLVLSLDVLSCGGGIIDVVEVGRVGGQSQRSLPPSGGGDGDDLGERAADELLEAVPGGAGEEDKDTGEDGGHADAVSLGAAQVVLHVQQHRDR